jgi:hypothetical protein
VTRTSPKRIDRELVARALALHARAYETLMRLGREALRDPETLSIDVEAALSDPRRAGAWLRARGYCADADDDAALGALVASFFHTSFHVERLEWAGKLADAQLRLGPRRVARREVQRRRQGGSAVREALHRICRDEGVRVAPATLRAVAADRALREDLVLWTYAIGIVLRTRGEGEGRADWKAWRSMRTRGRRTVDIGDVWESRERLRAALLSRQPQ